MDLDGDSDSKLNRSRSLAMRCSPAAKASNVSGHVRDRVGSDGILRMGSRSSTGGDVGGWNVAPLRREADKEGRAVFKTRRRGCM